MQRARVGRQDLQSHEVAGRSPGGRESSLQPGDAQRHLGGGIVLVEQPARLVEGGEVSRSTRRRTATPLVPQLTLIVAERDAWHFSLVWVRT